jgi:hypothetical protein
MVPLDEERIRAPATEAADSVSMTARDVESKLSMVLLRRR